MEYTHVTHTFLPIYDCESKILILGSFPSVKSREQNFYYGHPQNRFWRVLADIVKEEIPKTIEEKQLLLQKNRIAVWDVIASCDIAGSSDSKIRNVIVNDINEILRKANIKAVFANGGKAYDLYMKYCISKTNKSIEKLPSTSPANAAYSLEKLTSSWKQEIQIYLNN